MLASDLLSEIFSEFLFLTEHNSSKTGSPRPLIVVASFFVLLATLIDSSNKLCVDDVVNALELIFNCNASIIEIKDFLNDESGGVNLRYSRKLFNNVAPL